MKTEGTSTVGRVFLSSADRCQCPVLSKTVLLLFTQSYEAKMYVRIYLPVAMWLIQPEEATSATQKLTPT
jgi:hypothetical protein